MFNLLGNKVYAYENSEGDKGFVIAKSMEQAEKIFYKKYPKRKIVSDPNEYWKCGSYLFEVGKVKNNQLYDAFPW